MFPTLLQMVRPDLHHLFRRFLVFLVVLIRLSFGHFLQTHEVPWPEFGQMSPGFTLFLHWN